MGLLRVTLKERTYNLIILLVINFEIKKRKTIAIIYNILLAYE